MDTRLSNLEIAVRMAFQEWNADPTSLLLMKKLDNALEQLKVYTMTPPTHKGTHEWKTFEGLSLCICVAEPRCWQRHPYGIFDDCGDHNGQ